MARPSKLTAGDLSSRLMAAGPLMASDLATSFGVNRSTVTRALGGLGADLVSLGRTRRARYALRRNIRGAGSSWPLHRIGGDGQARTVGRLEALHGGWRVTWEDTAPAWVSRFADAEGFWMRLPFFLSDLSPRGFLGRAIARQLGIASRFPGVPRDWADDDIVAYLQAAGVDLPGDLIVGDDCLRRALALGIAPDPASTLASHQTVTRYPELAARAASDAPLGAAVGGEQPKFLATIEESGVERRHVLVKFSPPINQAAGRRWADLLAMEWHALSLLAEVGLADSAHRLIDVGGRRFLEVPRFDRSARGGRSGAISLAALAAPLIGHGAADWPAAAMELACRGLIDSATVRDIRRLHAFGELIGNIDMQAENLAFRLTDSLPLVLAPAYDMLPMLWAPSPQGELLDCRFTPQPPLPSANGFWPEMADLALRFWTRVIEDQRVSREFATTIRAVRECVANLRNRFADRSSS